jgi:hypothetical protein
MYNETSPPGQILRTAYPGLDLEATYRYLFRLEGRVFRGLYLTRDELIQALGFNSDSGRVRSVLGSLQHFKLFTHQHRQYTVSSIGLKLLQLDAASSAQDWEKYALQAATSPPLYMELYKKYGKSIAPTQISRITKQYDLHPQRAADIIADYNKTFRFALSRSAHALAHDTVPEPPVAPTKPVSQLGLPGQPGQPAQQSTANPAQSETVEIDFGDGLKLSIPKKTILRIYIDELGKKGWI